MTVLVLGANGFIGRNVNKLLEKDYEVWTGSRDKDSAKRHKYVDLRSVDTISRALAELAPDVVINCAGIVDNNETANQNSAFTTNLLNAVEASKLDFTRIVISGSSAEYGIVDISNIPVDEDTPLNATSLYGRSKIAETSYALSVRRRHSLPIVIARIFNPIGLNMKPKFLIPSLLRQIDDFKAGEADTIEVSRLDSMRDYVDVRDIALAIKELIMRSPKQAVYNIGSGRSTSNGELIELMLQEAKVNPRPKLIETSTEPEPLFAIQADISRMEDEFGWTPQYLFKDTIKEIIDGSKK